VNSFSAGEKEEDAKITNIAANINKQFI